ncbi:saccharopine dehydrogenase family protein [Actinospongicola halichondriae]|uniref:saccharopine dehydrogenase family protein n=1 Tax=Actinospongicola halichondriae TaxID=3236844 RepID=UPI003D40E4C3
MADLDVVLFGPTGVTGREVARHLARRAPTLGLRWGVAGRDRARIDQVLEVVGAEPDAVLIADVEDADSIDAMTGSATVIANLVGPYARYGEPVYAACARNGTHELNLTGETDWVKAMIDAYDDEATASGAKIVPTSGFEALPFDLGALLAAQTLHERTGDAIVDVDVAVSMSSSKPMGAMTDAVSGGTFISGVEAIQRGPGSDFTDPYLLDPPSSTARGRYDLRPRKHSATRQWLAPMFPSPFLNPAVVHRTAALLRDSDDPLFAADFRYREGTVTEATVPKPAASATAAALSVMSVGMGAAGRLPAEIRRPMAKWLLRVGPKAGTGPKPDDLDAWTYRLERPGHRCAGRDPGRRGRSRRTSRLQVDRHHGRRGRLGPRRLDVRRPRRRRIPDTVHRSGAGLDRPDGRGRRPVHRRLSTVWSGRVSTVE